MYDLGHQEKLLDKIFDKLIEKGSIKDYKFFDTVALDMSNEIFDRIANIEKNCSKSTLVRKRYFFNSNFSKKRDDVISGKTLSNYFNEHQNENEALKPISSKNEPTWCFFAVYLGYLGWKGYVSELSIEQGVHKFGTEKEHKSLEKADLFGKLEENRNKKKEKQENNKANKTNLEKTNVSGFREGEIEPTDRKLETKIKSKTKRRISILVAAFVAIIFAILYLVRNPYVYDKFEDNDEGVLILSFSGLNDKLLENSLMEGLKKELLHYPDVKIKVSKKVCRYESVKEEIAYAKKIGEKYNAKIVVWGSGYETVYPRITTVDFISYIGNDIRIKEFDNKEHRLPKEFIKKPAYFAKLIIGYSFYSKSNWETAYRIFSELLDEKMVNDDEKIVLLKFLADTERSLAFFENNPDKEKYLNHGINKYKRILLIDSTDFHAHFYSGINNIFLRKNDDALFCFKRALKHYDENIYSEISRSGINAYIGLLYLDEGKVSLSVPNVDGIIEDVGTISFINNNYNLDSVLYYYSESVKEDSTDSSIFSRIGFIKTLKHDPYGAIKGFGKALELDPKDSMSIYNIGVPYLMVGKPEKALAYFKQALKSDSTEVTLIHNIGLSYLHLDSSMQAIKAFNKVIKIDSTFKEVWVNLGSLYFSLDSIDKSNICFEQAEKLSYPEGFVSTKILKNKNSEEDWYKSYISSEIFKYTMENDLLSTEKEIIFIDEFMGDTIRICNPFPTIQTKDSTLKRNRLKLHQQSIGKYYNDVTNFKEDELIRTLNTCSMNFNTNETLAVKSYLKHLNNQKNLQYGEINFIFVDEFGDTISMLTSSIDTVFDSLKKENIPQLRLVEEDR